MCSSEVEKKTGNFRYSISMKQPKAFTCPIGLYICGKVWVRNKRIASRNSTETIV